uniref:Uncharacterized protein n=1 Tax=Candidatus Kentrum sp. MB TaxID=2138164 RepID=A0A450XAM0_9GAMM|nr:MAG: hypothetical protein BECKMB1821G_GA0114241_101935 [Candidatus Kentron sp. MB]VFK30800.1 MAG: hypothetical protein BECKMB1821I_GA0114274_101816 [Candidatus Kentron sp. MB]VFK75237.1 MAG: hypothetical protein BECKMB1821H_GA0114242_101816 [Candidatus Kentron sp. MB]
MNLRKIYQSFYGDPVIFDLSLIHISFLLLQSYGFLIRIQRFVYWELKVRPCQGERG